MRHAPTGLLRPLIPWAHHERVKHGALVRSVTGQLSDHPSELARTLADQVDARTTQTDHPSPESIR
jgi:hypothetical protein